MKLPGHPLVSCIMPTYNRRQFAARAIEYFICQDYESKELIIVDDGTDRINNLVPADDRIRYFNSARRATVGAKRNFACEQARGEIIVHWDDDDWMAGWRLTYQVENLIRNCADICGLDSLFFYNPSSGEAWKYIYPKQKTPWLAGGTLCYAKSIWRQHPFAAIDVGEDVRFVWTGSPKKLMALPNPDFYVAFVHPGNTSPKHTRNSMWHPIPADVVRKVMAEGHPQGNSPGEVDTPRIASATPKQDQIGAAHTKPLVTCLMTTRNRRTFIRQAIEYFLNQDYPSKELLILDDGSEPIADLIPIREDTVYSKLDRTVSLGEKRNLGVEASRGEIIVLWDDDDWYSHHRLSYQVDPIIRDSADATVLQDAIMFDLSTGRFWSCDDELRDKMFAYGVIGGTVAFRKSLFNGAVRFPKANLAEDAGFLRCIFESKARVRKLPCNGSFIYIRHGRNTWAFTPGRVPGANGWRAIAPPSFLPEHDLAFYTSLNNGYSARTNCKVSAGKKIPAGVKAGKIQSSDIPLSALGARLYREGAFEEALDCLERAAWIEGGDPWIMFDTGLCLLALHRPVEALGKLRAAQSRLSPNTWVYSAIGRALARIGKYSAAREAFESARRLDPHNGEAAKYLDGFAKDDLAEARRLHMAKKIPEAFTYLDAAIMKDRRSLRALEEKGDLLRELGEISEAFPYVIASMVLRGDGAGMTDVAASLLLETGYSDLAEIFSTRKATAEQNRVRLQAGVGGGVFPTFCGPSRLGEGGISGLVRELDTGEGSLQEDYFFLYSVARLLKARRILEVGTNTGVSSIVFAKAMQDSHLLGSITTIDVDANILKKARFQIRQTRAERYVEVIEGNSHDVLPRILEDRSPFDLCLLDGDHRFETVKYEFDLVKPHSRYILLHDSSLFEGVQRLVEEVRKSSDCRIVKLEYPSGDQWSEGRVVHRSSTGFALVETNRS